jgi:hypothetical protein
LINSVQSRNTFYGNTKTDKLRYDVFVITYLLHEAQSPSWEANLLSASQEIRRILWIPKVHYRIHNSPPSAPTLRTIDTVHAPHIPVPQDPS